MDKYHAKKLVNTINQNEKKQFNSIKHRLMFGGEFTPSEEIIARLYIRQAKIGTRFIRHKDFIETQSA